MTQDFAGKRAFVTGAGSGIGRETAIQLAMAGALVAVTDIEGEAALQTTATIAAQGGSGWAHALDVSNSEHVNSAVAAAVLALGPIDYLVNAAGVFHVAEVQDITNFDWSNMFAVHANGVFHCCRAVLPAMIEWRTGAIVNLTSASSLRGQSQASHFAAAKTAVIGFTKSIAREKAAYGIRVNAVAPGPIDTPQWRGSFPAHQVEEKRDVQAKSNPMGRLGTPVEVARVIAFLLSDAASYMTGQILAVDGGESMV